MCTKTAHIKDFGMNGCQVPVGNGICGESHSLDIIKQFRKLYEDKMNSIDSAAGGDCLQEKLRIQQEWIGDLTEQNEMLVRAVEELESEATERVQMLEEKLQQSAKCVCEVMKKYREHDFSNDLLEEPLQRIFRLESDQKNLLEFIRRARDENKWSTDGLIFYEVSSRDLLDNNNCKCTSNKRYLQPDPTEVRNTARVLFSLRNKPNCDKNQPCAPWCPKSILKKK